MVGRREGWALSRLRGLGKRGETKAFAPGWREPLPSWPTAPASPGLPGKVHQHPRPAGEGLSHMMARPRPLPENHPVFLELPLACDLGQVSLAEPQFSHLSFGNSHSRFPCAGRALTRCEGDSERGFLERCSVLRCLSPLRSLVSTAGCSWPLRGRRVHVTGSPCSFSLISSQENGGGTGPGMTPCGFLKWRLWEGCTASGWGCPTGTCSFCGCRVPVEGPAAAAHVSFSLSCWTETLQKERLGLFSWGRSSL